MGHESYFIITHLIISTEVQIFQVIRFLFPAMSSQMSFIDSVKIYWINSNWIGPTFPLPPKKSLCFSMTLCSERPRWRGGVITVTISSKKVGKQKLFSKNIFHFPVYMHWISTNLVSYPLILLFFIKQVLKSENKSCSDRQRIMGRLFQILSTITEPLGNFVHFGFFSRGGVSECPKRH